MAKLQFGNNTVLILTVRTNKLSANMPSCLETCFYRNWFGVNSKKVKLNKWRFVTLKTKD